MVWVFVKECRISPGQQEDIANPALEPGMQISMPEKSFFSASRDLCISAIPFRFFER